MAEQPDRSEAIIRPPIGWLLAIVVSLALLGGGKIAYVKMIRAEDVQRQFPQAPQLAPGTLLYALHAADGTPIMLTDSREAAIANAWSQELETVSVH